MSKEVSGVCQFLKDLAKGLLQDRKRKIVTAKPDKKASKVKKSAIELLERADNSDRDNSSSEDEKLLDSDMELGYQSDKSDGSVKSISLDEHDTIDIKPSGSKNFAPTKEQKATWNSYLKRGDDYGPTESSKIKVDRAVKKWTTRSYRIQSPS